MISFILCTKYKYNLCTKMYTLNSLSLPVLTFRKNEIHTDNHPFWRKKGKCTRSQKCKHTRWCNIYKEQQELEVTERVSGLTGKHGQKEIKKTKPKQNTGFSDHFCPPESSSVWAKTYQWFQDKEKNSLFHMS